MLIEWIKVVLLTIGSIIGLLTLIKAVFEYSQRNMLTRINLYLELRDKYARQPELQRVCAALGDGQAKVSDLTYAEKRLFLGTIETIALMVRSGVMNRHVAMYMFGYYVLAAWDSDEFWGDGNLNREDKMWYLYKKFAEEVRTLRTAFEKSPYEVTDRNLNFYGRLSRAFVLQSHLGASRVNSD